VRIAVVGAGALGSAFGAGFIRSGHEVTFIDVSVTLVDALNTTGITIVEGEARSTVAVRATTDAGTIATPDLVMVFVKAYQTDAAALMIAPILGPDTVLATLQNGLGAAEVLARRCPGVAIVYGVTYHTATVLEPGLVRHAVGPTFAGPADGAPLSAAQRLVAVCVQAGWPAEAMLDVAATVWKKLLMNSTNAVAALTGMNGGAEAGDEHMRQLLHDVMAETITVAHALGHADLDLQASLADMLEILARAGEGRASMLQDFDAGRRTEIDALNGAVVRAAERLEIAVPINRALYSLVKGWERTHGLA
jgi:2-dehydropantoate 2-reductase